MSTSTTNAAANSSATSTTLPAGQGAHELGLPAHQGANNNNFLKKIRSKYILKQIFDNLKKKNFYILIKYNKNIKDRIGISIKDYKEYSEIEIEIIPKENTYGKFINMKENEKYFHIYFNDNKEEIKRNYLYENDNVSKIKIIIDYQVKSFKKLFDYCKCIEYICFKKFYRNNITDMSSMF